MRIVVAWDRARLYLMGYVSRRIEESRYAHPLWSAWIAVRAQSNRRADRERNRVRSRPRGAIRADCRVPENQSARKDSRVSRRRSHARRLVGDYRLPRTYSSRAFALSERSVRVCARAVVRGVRRRRAYAGAGREEFFPARDCATFLQSAAGRGGDQESDR